jgi:hypothetical protein
MRRTRFQQGSLQIVKRARGRNAWEYRWYELQADGSRKRRCLIVGSVEQYPNEASAQKAVAALRADINAESPRTSLTPISVQTLIEHYREKELGANCSKTRKTQVTYVGILQQMDFASLGKLSRHRGQGSRCRAVASVAQVCERKQSQSSKHYECRFQSRCSVGMAWCESHTHGASERQADQDAHCAFHRPDCGTASNPEGTYAHDGIPRRVHGASGWGVARPQVEGHRFSEDGGPCHPLDRHATCGRLQDRSLSQAGSARFAIVEGPVELATAESLSNR